MQLTVRTYKAETRERVLAAIDRIAKGIAAAGGVPPDRAPIVSVCKDQFAQRLTTILNSRSALSLFGKSR